MRESSSRIARADPTIVASSPIARWRKPPTFALAYISPARSSKRRMSIIVPSHSRAASGSGSSCSAMLRGGYPLTPASDVVRAPRRPSREEVLRLERVEVLAEGPREAAHPARREVPEQDGLAVGDVDDLDRVAPDEEPVGRLRPHATAAAA